MVYNDNVRWVWAIKMRREFVRTNTFERNWADKRSGCKIETEYPKYTTKKESGLNQYFLGRGKRIVQQKIKIGTSLVKNLTNNMMRQNGSASTAILVGNMF